MNLLHGINYSQLSSDGNARFFIAIPELFLRIARFCSSKSDESCVLGVDRTFGLF